MAIRVARIDDRKLVCMLSNVWEIVRNQKPRFAAGFEFLMNKQRLNHPNSVCAFIVAGILIGALYFQFVLQETPCPLCLLQRMGMLALFRGSA